MVGVSSARERHALQDFGSHANGRAVVVEPHQDFLVASGGPILLLGQTECHEDELDAAVPVLEETYPLIPPFAFALIQTDPRTKRKSFTVMEVPLDSYENTVYKMILEILIAELDVDFSVLQNRGKAEEFLRKEIDQIISTYKINLNEEQRSKINYYMQRDLIGYGRIEPLFRDHPRPALPFPGLPARTPGGTGPGALARARPERFRAWPGRPDGGVPRGVTAHTRPAIPGRRTSRPEPAGVHGRDGRGPRRESGIRKQPASWPASGWKKLWG